jgi:hypothetical protein
MAKVKTPAVRHLRYEVTNSASENTETSHYVNLARDLSAINRRMMAEDRVYYVSKITVVSRNTIAGVGVYDQTVLPGATTQTQPAGFISVGVAPYSWTVINAVKMGRELYNKSLKEAMSAIDMKKARYNSFKIRGLHAGAPSPTYLVPKDNGGNSLQLGEWTASNFHSPDGTTGADVYATHILGPHVGTSGAFSSVGLVESYGNTRSTVSTNVPNPIQDTDDPLANLMDDGTVIDERLGEATFNGDAPPYDIDQYAGSAGNMSRPLVVQHGTLGADGRVTLGGFAAVHGLLEFEVSSPIANDVYSILVELKEGSFKGIKAEAY